MMIKGNPRMSLVSHVENDQSSLEKVKMFQEKCHQEDKSYIIPDVVAYNDRISGKGWG